MNRRSRALSGIAAGAACALAVSASPAVGDTLAPLYAQMEQRFTSSSPGAATGWRFDGALKPTVAGQQVPPQRSIEFVFPAGTRFDLGAVPRCTASDAQITSQGLQACPAGSRVGRGQSSLFLGPDSTLVTSVAIVVMPTGFTFVLSGEDGVLRVLRGTVRRNRVTFVFPRVDLPNGFQAATFRARLRVRRAGTARHPVIRTPRRCPATGRWSFTYLPRYDEPIGVQRSTSSTPCRSHELSTG